MRDLSRFSLGVVIVAMILLLTAISDEECRIDDIIYKPIDGDDVLFYVIILRISALELSNVEPANLLIRYNVSKNLVDEYLNLTEVGDTGSCLVHYGFPISVISLPSVYGPNYLAPFGDPRNLGYAMAAMIATALLDLLLYELFIIPHPNKKHNTT